MFLKIVFTALGCALSLNAMAVAPNPASKQWALQQITNNGVPQGAYTSDTWIQACPSGEAGLLAGCFTDGTSAAATPLKSLLDGLWAGANHTPSSTANSVYIKKIPAGSTLSANSGRNLTFDATGIPASSKAWCNIEALSESGLDIDCGIENNPTAGSGECIYNVLAYAEGIVSGDTYSSTIILNYVPGVSGALPLGVPIYLVCIGINKYTGVPASIAGMTIS